MPSRPPVDLTREIRGRRILSVFEEPAAFLVDGIWYHLPLGDFGWAGYEGHPFQGMLFSCPGCGEIGYCPLEGPGDKWGWDGNEDAPTLTPSIHSAPDKGGCGWHGFMTAGNFQLNR